MALGHFAYFLSGYLHSEGLGVTICGDGFLFQHRERWRGNGQAIVDCLKIIRGSTIDA